MFNMGQGPGAQTADLEQLARCFWDTWRDALQRTMPGADWRQTARPEPGASAWGDPMQWWTGGLQMCGGDETLRRFQAMATPWLDQVQQVAAGFVGRQASPEAIVAAWRDAMGADPVGRMFGALHGPGLEGWNTWLERLQPWLEAFGAPAGGRDAFSLPTFGLTREHQERWQQLAGAFAQYQGSQQDYQTLLMQASSAAFGLFERKLAARDAATPIESPRALFDLWIDAAEEAYAEVALSPAFRKAYADMVGGQMRLRQAVQREVEQACRVLDLPTRSELDGAHRKIAELERALRRVHDRLDAVEGGSPHVQAVAAEPPRRPAGPAQVETPAVDDDAEVARSRPSRARRAKNTAARRVAKTGAKTPPAKTAAGKAATKTQDIAAAGSPPRRGKPKSGARATTSAKSGRGGRRPVQASAAKAPARASRKVARAPSRVAGLPNLGFISPLPLAPEPLKGKAGKAGKPAKGRR